MADLSTQSSSEKGIQPVGEREIPQSSLLSRFWSWISEHLNDEDLKILFRCSLSAWVTMILVFITPSLQFLGSAAFFGAIVHFFFPPSGVVLLQLLVVVTMIVGIGLAWGWGAITMKAALAVRPDAETKAALRILEENAVKLAKTSNETVKHSVQQLILDGAMLDTRITAVYFVLGLVFIYFIARLQQKSPALVLLSFFAMIITDVFMTTGPLLYNFHGTLPNVIVLPSALSMAISIASAVLIFPRTTSYLVLSDISQLVVLLKTSLDTFETGINNYPDVPDVHSLRKNKMNVFGMYTKAMMKCVFLPLDMSMGRLGADDIQALKPFLRRLVITSDALTTIYVARSKAVQMRQRQLEQEEMQEPESIDVGKRKSSIARHQHHAMFDFLKHMSHENSQEMTASTIAVLKQPSKLLLTACQRSFESIEEALMVFNQRRWWRRPSESSCLDLAAKHEATLKNLRNVKHEFGHSTHDRLIAPYAELFDENGQLILRGKNAAAMHTLVLSMNLSERLLRVASATEATLLRIVELERMRTKTQLWLPSRLMAFYRRSKDVTDEITVNDDNSSSVNNTKTSEKSVSKSQINHENQETKSSSKKSKKNETPKRNGSKLGRAIVSISQWLSDQTGIFALRMTIVSFALAIPAVIPSSAGFYYREKGLWALIMGQTGLTIYMADLVFGLAGRFILCVLGGILGLAAWYIGSGSGTGNPYGLAAICAPIIVAMMFFRLHAPRSMIPLSVIGASTFVLVVGYGYIDTHLEVYENPGYGYTVFWKRTLLVTVGYVAAVIVQCFPAAPSATQHVAEGLSTSLDSLSSLYIKIVNTWLAVPDDIDATDTFNFDTYHLGKVEQGQEFLAHKLAMKILRSLSALGLTIKTVKYEASASPFTSEKLAEIHILITQIVEIESQLLGQIESLSPEFRRRFKQATAALNEALVADVVAVLAMVSGSLRTGAPLPALMPTPLLARSYGLAAWKGVDTLELKSLQDPAWPAYSLLTTGYITLLNRIDELVIEVKEAVGESHHIQGEIESGGWGFGYLKSTVSN